MSDDIAAPSTPEVVDSLPPGAIPEQSAMASASGIEHVDQLPPGAVSEDEYNKNAMPNSFMGSLSAASAGAAEGLLGPIAPWISKRLGETQQQHEQLMGAHPIASEAGKIGGLIGGAVAGSGVGGAMTKVGEAAEALSGLKAAAGAVGEFGPQIPSRMAQVGNSMLRGAAETAFMQASDEMSKNVVNPELAGENFLSNVGLAAAMGAGANGILTGAISPLWKATVGDKLTNSLTGVATDINNKMKRAAPDSAFYNTMKQFNHAIFGVHPEIQDEYMAHHAAVNALPEVEEINQHAVDAVTDVFDRVANSKASVLDTKAEYKAAHDQYVRDFVNKGADAKTANTEAQRALKDATAEQASNILNNATDAGDHAAAAVDALHKKITEGSTKAWDVLDKSDKTISLKGFLNKAEELAKDIEAGGTMEARAQADHIRKEVQGTINQFGPDVSGPQAKGIIQGYEKKAKWVYGAADFDNKMSGSYKQLRYELDSTLKDAVPEYRKAMEPLAKDVQLIGKLRRYGTPEQARTAIKGLKDPTAYKNNIPLLRELEDRTGSKFTHDIEPYANPEARDRLLKSIPEYAKAEQTAADLAAMKDPRTRQAMQDLITKSEEAKAFAKAQTQHAVSLAEQSKLKGITPLNIVDKLKKASVPGANPHLEEQLKNIPAFKGKTLPDIMNLMRVSQTFDKSAVRGSRMANIGAAVMAGLGSMLNIAVPGAGLGAAMGAYVDTNGPKLAKKALDSYMRRFGDIPMMAKETSPGATNAMLQKILGFEGQHDGDAFKAGVDYLSSAYKGNQTVNKAIGNVLKPSAVILNFNQYPKVADRDKLDKAIDQHQQHPDRLLQMTNTKLASYLEDHQQSVAGAMAKQLQYLQSLKPSEKGNGILDRKLPPDPGQIARYDRAKDIALQPTIVMQHIKDGTLQSTDMQDLQAMYPAMYDKMKQGLMEQIANSVHDEDSVPYKMRVGISLFTATPLDSSMLPSSILAAQPQAQQPPPSQGGMKPKPANLKGKTNNMYKTPGQGAEADRANRD